MIAIVCTGAAGILFIVAAALVLRRFDGSYEPHHKAPRPWARGVAGAARAGRRLRGNLSCRLPVAVPITRAIITLPNRGDAQGRDVPARAPTTGPAARADLTGSLSPRPHKEGPRVASAPPPGATTDVPGRDGKRPDPPPIPHGKAPVSTTRPDTHLYGSPGHPAGGFTTRAARRVTGPARRLPGAIRRRLTRDLPAEDRTTLALIGQMRYEDTGGLLTPPPPGTTIKISPPGMRAAGRTLAMQAGPALYGPGLRLDYQPAPPLASMLSDETLARGMQAVGP